MTSWTPCRPGAARTVAERVASGASGVGRFSVLRYTPRPSAAQRMGRASAEAGAQGAGWVPGVQVLRRIAAQPSAEAAADALLATRPRDERDRLLWVGAAALAGGDVRARPGEAVGLGSLCETPGGERRHLPLLDFSCPVGPEHEAFVRVGVERLGQSRGLLVESGNSYHYYGLDPVPEAEWRAFMTEALLLAPYVDARYVAHRLLGGVGVLRLGAGPGKPTPPRPIAVLGE